ncbi:hypothetical protein HEL23_024530 [Escherichia coli]|nr:hypothetical protein [Escherichia coli]MBB8072334.1 hypothetical protein [Escherichia coli]
MRRWISQNNIRLPCGAFFIVCRACSAARG